MSETTDIYTVSVKTSTGYDASLLVVRGNTADELRFNIKALHAEVINDLIDLQNAVQAADLVKDRPPAPPQQPAPAAWDAAAEQGPVPSWAQQQGLLPASLGGVQIQGPDPVQVVPAAQPVAGMFCNHGKRVFKNGTTRSGPKAGQAWSAWMCSAPQGAADKCDPIWG